MKVGDAEISQKHCNFFVNNGNAKSEDLEKLIYQVKKKVLNKTGSKSSIRTSNYWRKAMSNLIVVLMGGLSGERKISFLTGKACAAALKKKGYKVANLDAKGYFVEELKKLKPNIVFNALHGKYGEDGFVQSILESLKIPYTHSGVLSSSLAMDKELSRLIFVKNSLKVPKYFLLHREAMKEI